MKTFRESLKQEMKLLKQEVDLLPKSERKETLKARKEALEGDQNHREQLFHKEEVGEVAKKWLRSGMFLRKILNELAPFVDGS